MDFKKSFYWRSNLSNHDNYLEAGLKMGLENDSFWSGNRVRI